MTKIQLAAAFALVALAITGCTRRNPLVCCSSPDDCSSIGVDDEDELVCDARLMCVNHECVAPECSSDSECSGGTPHCAPGGTCVECVQSDQCPSNNPACDSAEHVCRGCEQDDECESGVCDADAGTCMDAAGIVYASPSGPASGACMQSAPCSIAHAFAIADTSRSTILLAPGDYAGGIVLAGKTVLVHGFGATINAPVSGRPINVNDGGSLRLVGVSLVAASGEGIGCEPTSGGGVPKLDLDRVTIDAMGVAVVSNPCNATIANSHVHVRGGNYVLLHNGTNAPVTMTIDRSILDSGDGVAVLGNGAILQITNSIISNQTGADGAANSVAGGRLAISFSTIVNSLVKSAGTGCNIDNSIIVNFAGGAPADTVTGTTCQLDHSIVYPQSSPLTGQNNRPGINPMLKDPGNGDYHLLMGSPAIDTADPAATNALDYDGTPRPQGPRSDVGAFEYAP